MKTRTCIIRKDTPAGLYFGDICRKTKALRNTTNFYIRNTYTGIAKAPKDRTDNEKEVLEKVFTGIQQYNEHKEAVFVRDMKKACMTGGLEGEAIVKRALPRARTTRYPSEKRRMLSYETLDAVFKFTKNPDYYRLPAQVNQNDMRKTFHAWKSFYAALKDWDVHPEKYKEKPRIPGYIREKEATAWFTNQTARIWKTQKGCILSFIGTEITAGCGHITGTYIKTEVQPYHGEYRLLVTYDDKAECPDVPEHPQRIYGIDTGVNNFAAVAGNFGSAPFLIRGGAVKSWNQWYNKKRAVLISRLTSGQDSKHSIKHSRRLDALSRKRDERMRDFFYKCAHYICRRAVKEQVEVIVCGHNDGIKQCVNFKKKDNQNFVCIPESRFLSILAGVGAKYGIPVVIREESYTSQASAPDLDPIPTYGREKGEEPAFSGKRIKRGRYRTGDGHILNADINGAANILRKEYPEAFKDITDFSYLWKTTETIGYRDIYKAVPEKKKEDAGKRNRPGRGSRKRHKERAARRMELKEVFPKKKTFVRKAS